MMNILTIPTLPPTLSTLQQERNQLAQASLESTITALRKQLNAELQQAPPLSETPLNTADTEIIGFKKTQHITCTPRATLCFIEEELLTQAQGRLTTIINSPTLTPDLSATSTISAISTSNPDTPPRLFPIVTRGGQQCAMGVESTGELPPEDFENIAITTGVCLFSNSGLKALCDRTGEAIYFLNPSIPVRSTISELILDPRLSFFEIESVERLADTILQLFHNPAIAAKNPEITLDIPMAEYGLYLMEPFMRGLVPPTLMETFFTMIEERCTKVTAFFQATLRKKFQTLKHLPIPTIRRAGLLDCILPLMQQFITDPSNIFSPDPTLSNKQQEKQATLRNSTMKSHIETLINAIKKETTQRGDITLPLPSKLKNFNDLSKVGYAHNYLNLTKAPSTLLLSVENTSEVPLFQQAATLLAQSPENTSQITTLFPLELYKFTPSTEIPPSESSAYFQEHPLTNTQLRSFYQSTYPFLQQ